MRTYSVIFISVFVTIFSNSLAMAEEVDDFEVFKRYSSQTKYSINHDPWTKFLSRAVYAVGRSDRQPARRKSSKFVISGTRLSTGSNSPYRHEGNRVLFHTFTDEVVEYVALYRQALQDTINRVDYGDLSRDEQLAFWLNLYNAVVVHEIALAHPVSKPLRIRTGSDNARLLDAKLVTVQGVTLSLNDIRYNIVYRYWLSSNVIYGFWDGTIGGPNILPEAFEGSTVNPQLQVNAREFVNSLRGVDDTRGALRFSEIYFDARPYYFVDWPNDLYAHLRRYADFSVATALSDDRSANPRASRYANNTADVNSGETIRPPGNDNAAAVAAGADLGAVWSTLTSDGMRAGFSSEALILQNKVDERRGRRTATVTVLDVYTEDPGGPPPSELSVETDKDSESQQPE